MLKYKVVLLKVCKIWDSAYIFQPLKFNYCALCPTSTIKTKKTFLVYIQYVYVAERK